MIKVKITWPLLALLAALLFAWIVREPQLVRPQPQPRQKSRRPDPRQAHRNGTHRRPHHGVVIDPAGDADPAAGSDGVSYEEAIRDSRWSPEDLSRIGDYEAFRAGQRAASDSQSATATAGYERLINFQRGAACNGQ